MKTLTHKLPTIVLLIAVFAVSVLFTPATAQAKWVDRSDELPGMDFNLTPYLIAAGVLVGGVVVYKIATSGSGSSDQDSVPLSEADATADNSDSVDEATTEDEGAEVGSTRGDHSSGGSSGSILVPEEESRLGLYFNVTDDRPFQPPPPPDSLDELGRVFMTSASGAHAETFFVDTVTTEIEGVTYSYRFTDPDSNDSVPAFSPGVIVIDQITGVEELDGVSGLPASYHLS